MIPRIWFWRVLPSVWIVLSSASIAQWNKIADPPGDITVRDFAIDGEQTLAFTDRGVYFSSNGGGCWTQRNARLICDSIVATAVESHVVFAGTGSGVLTSTDFGITWNRLVGGLPDTPVSALLCRGTDLFAGTAAGLFRTHDLGVSWEEIAVDTGIVSITSLLATPTRLYASTSRAGYRSTDWGERWERLPGPPGAPLTSIREVLFRWVGEGVSRSTDFGLTWSFPPHMQDSYHNCLVGLDTLLLAASDFGPYCSTDQGNSWAQPANLPGHDMYVFRGCLQRVFAGTRESGAYVSTDGGEHWTPANNGFPAHVSTGLATFGGILFCTDGADIFRSSDCGKTWTAVNIGRTGRPVQCIAVQANLLFAGTSDPTGSGFAGLNESTNLGDSWTQITGLFPVYSVLYMPPVHGEPSGTLLVGTASGLTRFAEFGTQSSSPLGANGMDYTTHVFILAAEDTVAFAGTQSGILRSTDQGATWTDVTNGLPDVFYALASLGTSLFAATGNGVYKSADDGDTWAPSSQGLPGSGIHTMRSFKGRILTGTSQDGIFASDDTGRSWKSWNSSALARSSVASFAFANGKVFASTDSGLFSRDLDDPLPVQLDVFTATDEGGGKTRLTWRTLSETRCYEWDIEKSKIPPDYRSIPGARIHGAGTTITPQEYSWTDTAAAPGEYYRLKQIDLDGSVHYSDAIQSAYPAATTGHPDVPARFSLEQNYPNPSNPTTRIRYGLPRASSVSLAVYNPLGQLVGTIIRGEQNAGYHEVIFDGSRLASGVYYYRLRAGAFVQTRKMLLIH